MQWFKCEARGAVSLAGDFHAVRFVQADAPEAAALNARKSVGRELVRHGVHPLDAEAHVEVSTVMLIDEDDVPGIVPDMVWKKAA